MQDPQPGRCLTTTIPHPMTPAVTTVGVHRPARRRPTLHDVSAATGKSVSGPVTAWTVGEAPEIVEHVAGAGPDGSLLVFYRSRHSGGWRVVDASADAGRRIDVAPVTSWVTRDSEFTVEHIAAIGTDGELLVFYWSPRNGRWRVVDATAESGRSVAGGLTSWVTRSGEFTVEHVAGVASTGELTVFWWSPRAGRWQAVNASAEAGRRAVAEGSLTSWVTADGEFTVEHVAAIGPANEMLVFYWSPRHGAWRVVDATAESGRAVTSGLTSWVTRSDDVTVEHVAGVGSDGELTVFWWSPRAGRWRAVPATRIARAPDAAGVPAAAPPNRDAPAEVVVSRGADGRLLVHWWKSALDWQVVDLAEATGTQVVGDPVAWAVPGATAPERLAARGSDGHLLVFESKGDERVLVDALRRAAFSLRRSRKVRRKVLTILADHHKPDIPRPSMEAIEAAVLGATESVRDYFLENSDGLFTIDSVGVLGWYDADHEPCDYWPYLCGRDGNGRDSVAEAIRKAAAEFDFASFDEDSDGHVEAIELGILWIQPGTGDGGGLNRKVGEDYTDRDTAAGITVDGKLITWIAEVSIGAPPGPGIIAHELTHLLLGHGDMYFGFFNSAAAGAYSLMDQDGRAPHLDPFAKLKLGWLHPRVAHRNGRYRLPDVETRHVALVLPNPQAQTEEYFIVENRWPGTSYDRVLPDQGLAVWHVMENADTYNAAAPPPNVSADEWEDLDPDEWARKGIRMIRPIVTPPFNDSRALWDGSDPETGYDLLSDDPDPTHATLRWADGSPSGYSLRDISAAGPEMEVTIEVPAIITTVPHVRFSPATQAARQIIDAALVPAFTGATDDDDSWVSTQSPNEGSAVPIGTTVTMRLRGGPVP